MSKPIVDDLKEQDRADWERLYHGYAAFYKTTTNKDKLNTIWSWIHDEDEAFWSIVARGEDGSPIGFMHYREMPSPLRGAKIGFLDDLFVEPTERGSGAVDALFEKLTENAKAKGWSVIRWLTGDDNYRARHVYDKLATRSMFLTYQMEIE